MARPSKIWYRKDTGWWMVTVDGQKIRLAEGRANRKLAEQKFHEVKAAQARHSERGVARIADIIDGFTVITSSSCWRVREETLIRLSIIGHPN